MYMYPLAVTLYRSSPKERVAITGLAELLFTSSTGLKLTFTPSRCIWRAISVPIS